MLNEFNTAIAAEGLKSISEGCKSLSEVCKSEYKKGNVTDSQMILDLLSVVATATKGIGDIIVQIGAKIDTKAADL